MVGTVTTPKKERRGYKDLSKTDTKGLWLVLQLEPGNSMLNVNMSTTSTVTAPSTIFALVRAGHPDVGTSQT